MKTYLIALSACLCLGSCADMQIRGSVETPYGTITSDKGGYVVTVKPIVIADK